MTLKIGDTIRGRYFIERFIGEGGMQRVYYAQDKMLDRVVAIKTPKNESAEKRFQRSAVLAAKINNPHVAKTYDYFAENSREFLVEEFVAGESIKSALLSRARYLDPYLVARVFHFLARGIAASHGAGVVHRDLKPDNVLVVGAFQATAIKITDFGIAKMAEEELAGGVEGFMTSKSSTVLGAIPYMAPEYITDPASVNMPADVWALGAMMYHLLTGDLPYGSGLAAIAKIQKADPPAFPAFITRNPQFEPLGTQLINLITRCMQQQPADRPLALDVLRECGMLCYPIADRAVGVVREIKYNAYGFISCDDRTYFYHTDSVYGEAPAEGDCVVCAPFPSAGHPRVHPVLKISC